MIVVMIYFISCIFALNSLTGYSHSSGLPYAGYALSSVEGRVAMEFFDLSEASQAKKYVIISFA